MVVKYIVKCLEYCGGVWCEWYGLGCGGGGARCGGDGLVWYIEGRVVKSNYNGVSVV